VEPQ